jgi:hypothetical protein
MRATCVFGVSICLLTGCASTTTRAYQQLAFAVADSGSIPLSIQVGEPRVITSNVNPLAPVTLSAEDGAIEVTFARSTRTGEMMRLDPLSLSTLSSEPRPSEKLAPASTDAARVPMSDGGYVLFYTEGSVSWGHRAMAQSFYGEGLPQGPPVAISPPDDDVLGAPRAATTDGRHVVATFSATRGGSFELVAVTVARP